MIQALNGLRPFALPSMVARGRGSAPIWTPAANFPLGTEPGLWYDPSSFTGLYQDSAGTSPATTVGQPAGLMLDKRLGLVLGPELVSNGGFDNGTAGWLSGNSAALSASAGVLVVAGNGVTSYPAAYQSIPTVIGETYQVTAAVSSASGATTVYATGSANRGGGTLVSQTISTTGGPSSFVFRAIATTSSVALEGVSASWAGGIDNISVRKLPGNHIRQATASARPIINNT